MSDRTLTAPEANPETERFWAAARDGELLIGRCSACERTHYYPRSHCPHCGASDVTWTASAGDGEIYSLSVMRRGAGAPYAVAYVTLDEGPAILTNIFADDLDALAIGDRVRIAFQPTEGDGPPVPLFTPSGD